MSVPCRACTNASQPCVRRRLFHPCTALEFAALVPLSHSMLDPAVRDHRPGSRVAWLPGRA
ncbi:hypothetical protein CHELA1G11_21718 [Hyphomicrobiales bacterium]|nr:hypothetical protein CHELA1G11_21718 [Hyphomicrobiales bacterium]